MLINKIYYINLDHRIKKNEFMINQLEALEIPFSRVSGVVCDDFKSYKIHASIEHGSSRHKGTVGCFLAHKKCLEEIEKQNFEKENYSFAVLEDDIIINKQIFLELEQLDTSQYDYDILFINSALQYGNKPPPNEHYLIEPNLYKIYCDYPYFIGAFFYILNLKKIRKILDEIEKISVYEDYDMYLFKNFTCYTYISPNVKVSNFKSDRDPVARYNIGRIDG